MYEIVLAAKYLKHLWYTNTAFSDTIIRINVFFKTTDTHELLHTTSSHPKHTVKGILKYQIINALVLLKWIIMRHALSSPKFYGTEASGVHYTGSSTA